MKLKKKKKTSTLDSMSSRLNETEECIHDLENRIMECIYNLEDSITDRKKKK